MRVKHHKRRRTECQGGRGEERSAIINQADLGHHDLSIPLQQNFNYHLLSKLDFHKKIQISPTYNFTHVI